MKIGYIIFLYFVIPMLFAVLTYAALLDLVGKFLAIVAGACIAGLFDYAFLNNFGKPIRW